MAERWSIARAIFIAAALLFVSNFGYGLIHESAHAVVVEAEGGQVYGIFVNPVGIDAYTEHSPVSGTSDIVLLNMAGIGVTTLLAAFFMLSGNSIITVFLAGRTAIYALNYTPGTDVSTIYAALGTPALVLSLIIAGINVACICSALGPVRLTKRISAVLSSFLWHVRPANNNAE